MNKVFAKLVFLMLFINTILSAESMFLLTKLQKVYLVVENYSNHIPMNLKADIIEEMRATTDELNIDTDGYSYRTLAFMLYDTSIGNHEVLNVDLILGEEVKRLDDAEDVYALTYDKRKQIVTDDKTKEEIHEELIEKVELLLNEFMEQYKEDNI